MFEAISDPSNPAPATGRFKAWKRNRAPSNTVCQIAPNALATYDQILGAARYRHFARIPGRIVRCLNYFKVGGDHAAAARILGAYYLFIAVVDDAIDSGELQTAAKVFEHLAMCKQADPSDLSEVAVMTENLKRQLDYKVDSTIRNELAFLYETVRQERLAGSIEAYLEVRKAVGRLTADLSYVLIKSSLDHDYQTLRTFMRRVGAVGCLVDSVIDLRSDERQGLLNFRPTVRDRVKLTLITLGEGLSIGLDHPGLAGLFAMSILDNLRDRLPPPSQMRVGRAG